MNYRIEKKDRIDIIAKKKTFPTMLSRTTNNYQNIGMTAEKTIRLTAFISMQQNTAYLEVRLLEYALKTQKRTK